MLVTKLLVARYKLRDWGQMRNHELQQKKREASNTQRVTCDAFFGLCDNATNSNHRNSTATNQGENMLNKNEIEMAVRLYENQQYGSTYGPGLYRKAVFNGSIDINGPVVKYVIDLYAFDDWSKLAKTDEQMAILNDVDNDPEKIYSWLHRYDTTTKQKTLVCGFCSLHLKTNEMTVMILDQAAGVEDSWKIVAKPCVPNKRGLRSPQLLATNADLATWS